MQSSHLPLRHPLQTRRAFDPSTSWPAEAPPCCKHSGHPPALGAAVPLETELATLTNRSEATIVHFFRRHLDVQASAVILLRSRAWLQPRSAST